MSFIPASPYSDETVDKLKNCLTDIKYWMTKNMLKLHKTRYLLFGTPQQLLKVNRPIFAASSDIMQFSLCERNLGVFSISPTPRSGEVKVISTSQKYFTYKEIFNFGCCKNSDSSACMFTD